MNDFVYLGGGDAWRISGEDRAKHDSQFFTLKPVNGFVTGLKYIFFCFQIIHLFTLIKKWLNLN